MKRVRLWVWFFVVLAILAAVAGVIEIWFNLSQQLTPEALEAARDLWRQTAPEDYDLDYTLTRQDRTPIRYQATVVNREVTAVLADGEELDEVFYALHDLPPLFDAVSAWLAESPENTNGVVDSPSLDGTPAKYQVRQRNGELVVKRNDQNVSAWLAGHYTPDAQFEAIARQLDIDRQPEGGRVFCVATFHRTYGLVLRYVRSVSATRERVQIQASELKTGEVP